jgi:hypothetical protein
MVVSTPEYPINTQAQFVCGLAVVHNFIRIYDPEDFADYEDDEDEDEPPEEGNDGFGALQRGVTAAEKTRAEAKREEIALAMWADYEANDGGRRRQRAHY